MDEISGVNLDRLVRLVMTDLGLDSQPVETTVPTNAAAKKADVPQEDRSDSAAFAIPEETGVHLTARVIATAQLKEVGVLTSAPKDGKIWVPRGAVITPSAKDELKKRRIQILFELGTSADSKPQSAGLSNAGKTAGRVTLSASNWASEKNASCGGTVLASSETASLYIACHALPLETIPSHFLASLQKERSVTVFQKKCIFETAAHLAEAIEKDAKIKGIILTEHAAIAGAACNRHSSLRAIVGYDAQAAESDALALGANLLIIDPKRSGFYLTQRMIKRFAASGPATCPAILRKGLEG